MRTSEQARAAYTYLRPQEVADRLGVPLKQVKDWIIDGVVDAINISTGSAIPHYRIAPESICKAEKLIAGQRERLRAQRETDERRRSVRAEASRTRRATLADTCEACGWKTPVEIQATRGPILHMHHVVPVAAGGTNESANLVTLCPNCHALAHALWSAEGVVADRGNLLVKLKTLQGST